MSTDPIDQRVDPVVEGLTPGERLSTFTLRRGQENQLLAFRKREVILVFSFKKKANYFLPTDFSSHKKKNNPDSLQLIQSTIKCFN